MKYCIREKSVDRQVDVRAIHDWTVREWGGDKVFLRQERGGRKEIKVESMEEDGSDLGEPDRF